MSAEPKGARKKDPNEGKLHNAEEFADYVHAVTVPMKIVMLAIVVFFAGAIVFCIFGKVAVTISVAAIANDSDVCTCYVKTDDRDGIEPGDEVEIQGETYKVSSVSSETTTIDSTLNQYALSVGNLAVGDEVCLVTIDSTVSQGVYSAVITKDYLQPLSMLLTS